ncbi:MAG: hypothetical protein M0D57_20665 [Sphingobacteriales bacterium JAD_PAG50586_3]|nr:MAG: hypothetical protein M0D57_20665 [Sphingobacteriales bacterium JAD_PAG50586_3]
MVENAGVKGPKYNFDDGGYSLGADKVIVLNPFYIKLDERKSTPILYVSGESAQHRFNDKIINMSKEADLDIELIDKNSFTSDNTDKYNDTGVLIDWLDERLNHKDLNILPTDNTRIDEISKKYGAEYLVIPGAVNYIYKSPVKKVPLIIISVLLPVYSWPFIFPFLFKKFTATGVYTIVFNLKTGKQEMSKVGVAPYGDRYDVLYSFLYDYLSQIKRPGVSNNK